MPGALSENPGFKPVVQHKYRLDDWVTEDSHGNRTRRFRGRCTCGAHSGSLTSAGMAASWHGTHIENVLAGKVEA